METSIYGLKCEFKYQNEQSIMFYEKDGKELTTEDFNSVQLKMIQSNRIPHLLPLTVENIDLSAKLYYNIQSKSKIVSFFRNNRTTMNDYYQLFLSLVKTLEDSSSYMLNQEHYILHTDYIFIGKNTSDVYVAYLPVVDLERETTAMDDMKQLLTDIAGEVEGLQGNEFKSILSYIRSHNFSLPGLKKLLIDLMSLRPHTHNPESDTASTSGGVIRQESDTSDFSGNGLNASKNGAGVQKEPKQSKVVAGSESNNVKVKKVLPALTSREGVYLIVAILLGVAITWKVYEIYQNQIMLIVCTVLSLAIIVSGFVYWKVWRPGVEAETKTVAGSTKKKQRNTVVSGGVSAKGNVNQGQSQQMNNQGNVGGVLHNTREPQTSANPAPNMAYQHQASTLEVPLQQEGRQQAPVNPGPQPKSVPHVPYQSQPGGVANHFAAPNVSETVAQPSFGAANADDTVLLDDEDDMPDNQNQHIQMPFLIRTAEDGQADTMQVNQANFLIGRNDDSVNYADKTRGVSRLHVEIIRIDASSYGIKDLGSKNGSKLNGNAMVPYKVYALHEEDVFSLGKATYTFTWSVQQ